MKFIKNIMTVLQANDSGPKSTLREISDQLRSMDEDKATRLALYAFILARVAYADREIVIDELEKMEDIIKAEFKLSFKEAHLVIQLASHRSQFNETSDNQMVTTEFYNESNEYERLDLLDSLFAVASADQTILNIEAKELEIISDELKISKENFEMIRKKYQKLYSDD